MHKAVITLLIFLLTVNILMTSAGVYFKREINYSYLGFDNEQNFFLDLLMTFL